jgi:hypothetical protein
MILLLQFLLRLTFGLATGMALTSPRQVTSGYYRNHLYVALGLSMLAALMSYQVAIVAFWPAVLATVTSYVGAICWLYEKPRAGITCLVLLAGLAILATWLSLPGLSLPGLSLSESSLTVSAPAVVQSMPAIGDKDTARRGTAVHSDKIPPYPSQRIGLRDLKDLDTSSRALHRLTTVSSGLLLGITMAAMLLGHWYLNSPTMELAPLRRLILALAAAVVLQMVISTLGLWGNIDIGQPITTQWVLFLLIRWLFGLVGVSLLTWMAWQTLKIPNTQSATGILYVAVIGTFVGETMALLLSSGMPFPL